MAATIPDVLDLLKRIDALFVNYLEREALPIKNWRGQPAPATEAIENKLKECIGERINGISDETNGISYKIKDAFKTANIFTRKGAGIDEIKRVCDSYSKALLGILGMKNEPKCTYGFGTNFRVVKVVTEANILYTELATAKKRLNSVKNEEEVQRLIDAMVAVSMVSQKGGRRKTRRIKRRRYTRK